MRTRVVALTLVLLMMALAAGCGKNAPEPGQKKTSGATASSTSSSGGSGSTGGTGGSGGSAAGTSSGGGANAATGGSSGSTAGTSTAAQSQQAPQKVSLGPLKTGQGGKVGPVSLTLSEVNVIGGRPGVPQGYAYVLMKFTVENTGNDPYTVNVTDHFRFETPEGKKMNLSVPATALRNPRLQGTLQKGVSLEGWLGYLSKVMPGDYRFIFSHGDLGEAFWHFNVE